MLKVTARHHLFQWLTTKVITYTCQLNHSHFVCHTARARHHLIKFYSGCVSSSPSQSHSFTVPSKQFTIVRQYRPGVFDSSYQRAQFSSTKFPNMSGNKEKGDKKGTEQKTDKSEKEKEKPTELSGATAANSETGDKKEKNEDGDENKASEIETEHKDKSGNEKPTDDSGAQAAAPGDSDGKDKDGKTTKTEKNNGAKSNGKNTAKVILDTVKTKVDKAKTMIGNALQPDSEKEKKIAKMKQTRERYVRMTQKEKRVECKDRQVELKTIPSWADDHSVWTEFTARGRAKSAKPKKSKTSKYADQNTGNTNTYQVRPDLNKKVSLWQGDITSLEIDAIVNAANKTLLGGGGVDGAIHRAAGGDLLKETSKMGGCETGEAKLAAGYKLPARYVMLTVGPIGEHGRDLHNCYRNCMELLCNCKERIGEPDNLKTIAFPCISTGIYGYPNEKAAHVAIRTIREFLEDNGDKVDRVIFCLFMDVDINIYSDLMHQYFPVASPVPESKVKAEDTTQSAEGEVLNKSTAPSKGDATPVKTHVTVTKAPLGSPEATDTETNKSSTPEAKVTSPSSTTENKNSAPDSTKNTVESEPLTGESNKITNNLHAVPQSETVTDSPKSIDGTTNTIPASASEVEVNRIASQRPDVPTEEPCTEETVPDPPKSIDGTTNTITASASEVEVNMILSQHPDVPTEEPRTEAQSSQSHL